MKTNKYVSIIGLILFFLSLSLGIYFTKEDNSFKDTTNTERPLVGERTLSMMLEKETGSGEYEMVTRTDWPTDGYVFNETLSKCENGGELSWDNEKNLVTMTGGLSDKCYAYFDKVQSLADYIKSLYTGTQGENGLYHHDGTLENGINDGSYRYAGASDEVDNYVCISDEETCSDANLFRIIGVFDKGVKLIKATSVGSHSWAENRLDVWANASLNTYLNGEYLTSLGDFGKNIETTTWNVGYNTGLCDKTPANVYEYEVSNLASPAYVSKKIGLMYVSDFMYAAKIGCWKSKSCDSEYSYSSIWDNWLFLSSNEWTISSAGDDGIQSYSYFVGGTGKVISSYPSSSGNYAVRPTFYLTDVIYNGGGGSLTSPIRIN